MKSEEMNPVTPEVISNNNKIPRRIKMIPLTKLVECTKKVLPRISNLNNLPFMNFQNFPFIGNLERNKEKMNNGNRRPIA